MSLDLEETFVVRENKQTFFHILARPMDRKNIFLPSVSLPSPPLTNDSLVILENPVQMVEISGNLQLIRTALSVELA